MGSTLKIAIACAIGILVGIWVAPMPTTAAPAKPQITETVIYATQKVDGVYVTTFRAANGVAASRCVMAQGIYGGRPTLALSCN